MAKMRLTHIGMSTFKWSPFQFWSRSAAAGMRSFQLQGCDILDDCQASVEMCTKINDLADAMNSNRPCNALKLESPEFKVTVLTN